VLNGNVGNWYEAGVECSDFNTGVPDPEVGVGIRWRDAGEFDVLDNDGRDEASLLFCDACSRACGGSDILLAFSAPGEVAVASAGEVGRPDDCTACGVETEAERWWGWGRWGILYGAWR